jgi:hypothetical protein
MYRVVTFTGFRIGPGGSPVKGGAVDDFRVVDERGRTVYVVPHTTMEKQYRRARAQRRCDLLNGVRARVYVKPWRWTTACLSCGRVRNYPAPGMRR